MVAQLQTKGEGEALNHWLVIALDSLEFSLVQDFKLHNLFQTEYGMTDVSDFPLLVTPIIWGSFITGIQPRESNRGYTPKWENPLLERLRMFPVVRNVKGKTWFFDKLGFKRRDVYNDIISHFKESGVPTLFDVVPNSKALSVPPIQKWINDDTRVLMRQAIESDDYRRFERNVWQHFKYKFESFMEIVKENTWTLFMCHFMFPDLLGHFNIGDQPKMLEIYSKADRLLKEVKECVRDDTIVLVVSDHGMTVSSVARFGEHSNYGFYSCNRRLGLKHPKVTRFHDIILRSLNICL